MEAKIDEEWTFIPGTDGRFMFSNHGHVLMFRLSDSCPLEEIELPITCLLKTGELGWLLRKDDFRSRDSLMRLFDGHPTLIDHSKDAAALEARKTELARRNRAQVCTDGTLAERRKLEPRQ